jgi:hypothetical protein
MFYVPGGLPGDHAQRFAGDAAPPIDTLGRGSIGGWVTSRHLLDRDVRPDGLRVGGYLYLALMKAERKIPEALLRAECKMEEYAQMRARGAGFLNRSERAEIRKSVTDRLLPQMPPTLSGIQIVYDERAGVLFSTAVSEKQVEALTIQFSKTLGVALVPLEPMTSAVHRNRKRVQGLPPSSFSPECGDDEAEESLGQEFLTWLWFFSEQSAGKESVTLGDLGEFGVLLEGPLVFVRQGDGAHETVVRRGAPTVSVEAKTALMAGKKLRQARLTVARAKQTWTATVSAEDFVLRSVKLPKGEAVDPTGRFQERMLALETLRDAFLRLYDLFLGDRLDPSRWTRIQQDIHAWVKRRTAKR